MYRTPALKLLIRVVELLAMGLQYRTFCKLPTGFCGKCMYQIILEKLNIMLQDQCMHVVIMFSPPISASYPSHHVLRMFW